jgi:menaquinone-dependent protoporphyrinogen oxidase
VSLAAHGDTGEAERYLEEFEEGTTWRPARVALFSGALLYTQYGWLKRHIMRAIVRREGGDLDTSHDYEYTDWDAVEQFADDVHRVVDFGELA